MSKTNYYYPQLDTLRFLAFLLVLIHHANFPEWITPWQITSKYGWMGVDLFLCLSAFLFTRLLFAEYKTTGRINFRNFYIRRALRIWPLYYLFLGITLGLTVWQSGWSSGISQRTIGMVFFADNILSAVDGYNLALLYAAHLWTISYEEQFYFIIPWVLNKLYRLKAITNLYLFLGVYVLGVSIRAYFIYSEASHPVIWVLPITHFESILGGMLVGLGLFDGILKKGSPWLWFFLGLVSLWQVTRLPNVSIIGWKLMLTYPLVGLGMSLIIYAAMQPNFWFASTPLKNRAMGYLGKISYGLYVYHLLGLHLGYRITDLFFSADRLLAYPVAGLFAGLVTTVAISIVSYEIVEKPFLRIKDRFSAVVSRKP